MSNKITKSLVQVMVLSVIGAGISGADTPGDVRKECSGCHRLEGPAGSTPENRQNRKGPPLFYAGNKFRRDWLVEWLQDPYRIRPAGDFPATSGLSRSGKDGEEIPASELPEHPSLDRATAERYTDWLMTLTPHDDAIEAEKDYKPGRVSPRMGAMDFVKFKGCGACHRDTIEYGGVSGPELYTAWERLQPSYIISYIRDPTAWEPVSIMPNKHLKTPQIHKLVDYLHVLDKQGEQ